MKNFYKNILLFLFLILVSIVTTACVKIDTKIVIDKNGNADVSEKLLVLNSLPLEESEEDRPDWDATIKEYNRVNSEYKNYKAEFAKDGEYSGIAQSYHVDNILKNQLFITDKPSSKYVNEQIATFYLSDKNSNNKIVTTNQNFFNTEYKINIFIKYADDFPDAFIEQHNFSITIPVKAKEHNANYVDESKHVYSWVSPKNIQLTFSLPNIKKIDTNISIDQNGNAEISEKMSIPNTILDFNEESNIDNKTDLNETIKEYNNVNKHYKNYRAELVKDSQYTAIVQNYKVDDISKNKLLITDKSSSKYIKNQIASLYLNNNNNGQKITTVNKKLFITDYKIDVIICFPDDLPDAFIEQHNFSITIPVKANEHNANYVDETKHIYTWISPKNIQLTFSVIDIKNILIASLSILVSLIMVIAILILLRKAKEKNKKFDSNDDNTDN